MNVKAIKEVVYDQLPVSVYEDNASMGQAAAEAAAAILKETIARRGTANLVVAAANSQLTTLHTLRELPGVDWPAVNVFHMDEYVNLPPGHPASFSFFLHAWLFLDRDAAAGIL